MMSRSLRILSPGKSDIRPFLCICRHYYSSHKATEGLRVNCNVLRPQPLSSQRISPLFYRYVHYSSSFKNEVSFHNTADETLDALSQFFDGLCDEYNVPSPDEYDVNLGDGVLTLHFGGKIGTYVINKQTPNKQIWLSSPSSGPKRYDFINNEWVYQRDNMSLHNLLSKEMSEITNNEVNLTHLPYGGESKEQSDS